MTVCLPRVLSESIRIGVAYPSIRRRTGDAVLHRKELETLEPHRDL